MSKKILKIFLLLALAFGLYAMTANVKADGGAATARPTATRSVIVTRTPTATPAPRICTVTSGAERGTVNIRTCGGTSCEVIRIATEGESLNILSAGAWVNVITNDGIAGYINSIYCKGK